MLHHVGSDNKDLGSAADKFALDFAMGVCDMSTLVVLMYVVSRHSSVFPAGDVDSSSTLLPVNIDGKSLDKDQISPSPDLLDQVY